MRPLILLGDVIAGFQEHAGQRLQHVGLVHQGDLLAAKFYRMFKRIPNDPFGDPSAGVDAVMRSPTGMWVVADRDVVLERDIQAFEVLAHQDQVDILEPAARNQRAGRGANWRRAEIPPAAGR